MALVVCGLDQALRKSGAAIMDHDRLVHAQAFTAKGETHGEIFHSFRGWFRALLVSYDVKFLALEEPLVGNLSKTEVVIDKGAMFGGSVRKIKKPITTMQTMLGLYGTRGHAVEICTALNIPYIEVNNQEWRSVIYGRRHAPKGTTNASQWWKKQALERCHLLGWDVKSQDAAEACMIAEYARIHLGLASRGGELALDSKATRRD